MVAGRCRPGPQLAAVFGSAGASRQRPDPGVDRDTVVSTARPELSTAGRPACQPAARVSAPGQR